MCAVCLCASPVERVGGLGGLDAVQRDLAAHQEDKQRDRRPQHFFTGQGDGEGERDRKGGREGGRISRQRQVSAATADTENITEKSARETEHRGTEADASRQHVRRRAEARATYRKGMRRSGCTTSGRTLMKGRTSDKNRNPLGGAIPLLSSLCSPLCSLLCSALCSVLC